MNRSMSGTFFLDQAASGEEASPRVSWNKDAVRSTMACGFLLAGAAIVQGQIAPIPAPAPTFPITETERLRLSSLQQEGVLDVQPVILPEGEALVGDNFHFGWPVAVKAGPAIVCVFHRTRHHVGAEMGPRRVPGSSDAVVIRSLDGGRTWSQPFDLHPLGRDTTASSIGFGVAIGAQGDKVWVAYERGVFLSPDAGVSWAYVGRPENIFPNRGEAIIGPRLIVHPQKGLVLLGQVHDPKLKGPEELFTEAFLSPDEGRTWTHERWPADPVVRPVEPTGILHNGRLILLSRNHPYPFSYREMPRRDTPPSMLVAESGWPPFDHRTLTNISSFGWPDTTDVDFNPVTNRYEALVTNRNGGGPDSPRNEEEEQTVNLWSIAPEDLLAGRGDAWRFEATLVRFREGMREKEPQQVDAAHPGAAVMDVENGVQHIFIYCGTFGLPTGIYRITRTLDTNRLRDDD